MKTFDDFMFAIDLPEDLRMAALLEAAQKAKKFDYCDFIELVNCIGGDDHVPAFNDRPEYPGDNMGWFGFKYWMEHATFSVVEGKWKLPTCSGVYAVTAVYPGENFLDTSRAGALHTLYVGCAENIAKRVSHPDHWYQRARRKFQKTKFHAGLYVLPTTDYKLYERSLIRGLRPMFNIHHRHG